MSWGAIAAGAVSVVGSLVSRNGAKSAARDQVKGADRATEAQMAALAQARQDLAPWRETGGQALNSLSSGLGLAGYYPNEKPLSFEEWSAKNPQAAAATGGGGGGVKGALVGSSTAGLLSGGDPIMTVLGGLFGSHKKKPSAPATPAIDPHTAYQDYVKNFVPATHADPGTPLNDFNRDFTIADFEANKDPGYQFRMDEGSRAREGANAATVGVQNGRTLRELTRYGQDYASGEYSNAYNRFNADRNTRFNRLATVAGLGQTAVNTGVTAGQNTANNVSENIIGQANATAAGRVGQANAINDGLTTLGNYYLQRRYGGGQPKSI